jgi:ATP-dependent Clp protease adapter protein ClpS
VLVEIVDRWPSSFLQEQGMTRYDAVTFLSHGTAKHTAAPGPREGVTATFKMLLLNDDYTPMEFVVVVIQEFFNKDRETATQIMLKIHLDGKGICGVYSRDVAATKVQQVQEAARQAGHPLQCVSEPVD